MTGVFLRMLRDFSKDLFSPNTSGRLALQLFSVFLCNFLVVKGLTLKVVKFSTGNSKFIIYNYLDHSRKVFDTELSASPVQSH